MPVAEQPTSVDYVGDGVQTVFPVPFTFYAATQLAVYVELAAVTNWTVAWTATGVGSVVFAAAPVGAVRILRDTPYEQTLVRLADPDPADYERQMDLVVMMVQELAYRLGRAVQVDPRVPGTPTAITLPGPMIGRALVWEDAVGALTNSSATFQYVYDAVVDALARATAADAKADQALAQTRPEFGAELSVYKHTLVAGTNTYTCAPSGLPAPAAANIIVHYDGTMLVPDTDYTLSVDGLSIILAGDVVASAPESDEFLAGLSLVCVKIAGGLITADITPRTIGTTELALKAVTTDIEADGTANSVRVYDASGRPGAITGTNGQYLQFGPAGPVAGSGPAAASPAEVRAGTSTTKFVTPATAAYASNAPLFVARWGNTTVNGAAQLLWMQTAIPGNISLSRTGVGARRLTHPSMTAAPLVTFIGPAANTAPLRARVFLESPTVTVIESWSSDSAIDAGVVVTMYGSLN